MQYSEIARSQVLVGRNGGEVTCITSDGEIRWEMGVQAGQIAGTKFSAIMHPSDTLQVSDGVYVITMGVERVQRMTHEAAVHSDANPDWRPPQGAEAMIRKLEQQIASVSKQNKTLAAKTAALAKVQNEKQAVLDAEAKAKAEAEALLAKQTAEAQAKAKAAAEAVQNEAETAE